ncbi:WD40-repeat-containing domain protein [Syncephalastrum racemosum]|uniref:WD40-repeat-containing domain protein n=1 Tax=Syncephalastrum racemosum TaxID=13706 RepID=A0A1X2H0H7_SYNRA|nr:WD40-repeat-containing domain protein [Syncephalastrum racemosum]
MLTVLYRRQPLVIFGHTARVWDCQFVDNYLVSISEVRTVYTIQSLLYDLSCRVWRNSFLDKSDEVEADCLAVWEGHVGKNVWCGAVSPDHAIVATGGQDSGIRLWSLGSLQHNKIDSEDDLKVLPHFSENTDDMIRNFCLLDEYNVAIISDSGSVFKAGLEGNWTAIAHDVDFLHYAIMQSSPCGRIVVIGSVGGKLLVVSTEGAFEPVKMDVHTNKVFEIFIKPSTQDPNVFYIVSSGFNEHHIFHHFDASTSQLTSQFILGLPVERTRIMSVDYAEQQRLLICGSRESALLVYHLPDGGAAMPVEIAPVMQLRRSHGREGVSAVAIKEANADGVAFWTTGRDGRYIQYRLSPKENASKDGQGEGTQLGIASRGDTIVESSHWVLETVYRNRVTKGWLEGLLWIDGELLLLGFYRKRFFIYNETKGFEMISIACGGGHRRWNFRASDAKLQRANFAFVRNKMLHTYVRDDTTAQGGFDETLLQDNYHGRDVRAFRYLDLFQDPEAPLLFATGSEDTLLKFHQYMPSLESGFITLASVRKHKSVIKSVEWSRGQSDLLFTSGATEELYCWKLETTLPENAQDGLVDIKCLEWASCPHVSESIETRIMDITVLPIVPERGLHLVGAGYSDATIRIWLLNETTRQFSLVADGSWHRRCLLQITHIVLPQHGKPDRILFLTSATDGRIAVWDISEDLHQAVQDVQGLEADPTMIVTKLTEPSFAYQAHQSGINALEVIQSGNGDLLVLSGGEDNAVSAAKLRVQDNGAIVPVGKPFNVPSAHASSVTGLKIIHNGKVALTTSTDQRLNAWAIREEQSEGVALDLVDIAFVDVPDPSTMDAIEYRQVINAYLFPPFSFVPLFYRDRILAAITGIGLQGFSIPTQRG